MMEMEFFEEDQFDEISEKDRSRQERLKSSKKARDRRALIKDKKLRQYESGFRGSLDD